MAESEQGAEERPESHVVAERREKLERLRADGVEPFPHEFDGRERVEAIHAAHAGLEDGEETEEAYRVAGRLAARREMGKAAFLDLVDGSGRIQIHARRDVLGEEEFARLVGLDLGDLIGVDGTVFKTRRGELSLRATAWTLLAKSLRPPPDKFHGLEDTELRYRHREIDLIANPETRELFRKRGATIAATRRLTRRRRLRRGRDPGPAAALRRRAGAPVHHPPQRARPRPLPANRDRALPEALHRRRDRARLRARQGLSQRGRLVQAQPGVHDA